MAHGSERIVGPDEDVEAARIRRSEDLPRGPQEARGRLSNPAQRRLSPTDVDDLVDAYRAGASISQLAAGFGVHRTTVAAHLDRLDVPRHHARTAWDDRALEEAAELYAAGLSLADLADRYQIDAAT